MRCVTRAQAERSIVISGVLSRVTGPLQAFFNALHQKVVGIGKFDTCQRCKRFYRGRNKMFTSMMMHPPLEDFWHDILLCPRCYAIGEQNVRLWMAKASAFAVSPDSEGGEALGLVEFFYSADGLTYVIDSDGRRQIRVETNENGDLVLPPRFARKIKPLS